MMPKATRPRIEVIVGPARSGKTSEAIRRLRSADDAFVVQSKHQLRRIQAMLADAGRAAATATDIESLVASILKDKGERSKADRSRCVLECRRLAMRACGGDSYFAGVSDTYGFAPALAGCLAELKRAMVTPDDLALASESDTWRSSDRSFARKARDIVALFRAYEQGLREAGLLDRESEAALAASILSQQRHTDRVVVFDGFWRFEPVWRALFDAYARAGARMVVTLPFERSRPLLFAATQSTLEALGSEFDLDLTELPASRDDGRPGVLVALERGLFAPEPPPPPPADPAVLCLYDAPNPYAEAEMVLRAIRRAHDEQGIPWVRCGIVLRSVGDVAGFLPGICDRLGVPVYLPEALPLRQHRLTRMVEALLRVVIDDWRRDDVEAYLDAAVEGEARLSLAVFLRKTRAGGVRDGRAAWDPVMQHWSDDPTDARYYLNILRGQADAGAQATTNVAEAGGWLNGVVGSHVDATHGATVTDVQARKKLSDSIGMVAALLSAPGGDPADLERMWDLLVAQWEGTRLDVVAGPPCHDAKSAEEERWSRVLVLEPHETREREMDLVAVMGLTERVFPRRVVEDPFFREEEREVLRACGVPLEPRAAQADEERLRFYAAVTAAGKRLILSYPRASEESDNLRSFFLDEVEAAVGSAPAIIRTLADVAPSPEECVDEPSDRLLSATAMVSTAAFDSAEQVLRRVRAAGLRLDEAGEEALLRAIESRGKPPAPRIEEDALRSRYARPRAYSVSEIETYRDCPFRHFAQFALHLSEEEDPAGDARRGLIWHQALSKAMRDPRSVHAQEAEELNLVLQDALRPLIPESGMGARAYREEMLRRALTGSAAAFAEREIRYRRTICWEPKYHELAFGPQGNRGLRGAVSENDRGLDPASKVSLPLRIEAPDGLVVQVSGIIDRVDLSPDGTRALVMDYKTGHAPSYSEMRKGESIQLAIYLMAIEQVWGLAGAAAAYDSVRDDSRFRIYRTQYVDAAAFAPDPDHERGAVAKPISADDFDELVASAMGTVRAAVAGIRSCDITPTPGDHCRFCPFGDVCRTTVSEGHDGEPLPEPAADADDVPPATNVR